MASVARRATACCCQSRPQVCHATTAVAIATGGVRLSRLEVTRRTTRLRRSARHRKQSDLVESAGQLKNARCSCDERSELDHGAFIAGDADVLTAFRELDD